MAEVRTTFWFCTLRFSISAATRVNTSLLSALTSRRFAPSPCFWRALSLKMRTWISLGGPFLKVPVVVFLYLWANVMELNTKWFHCIETFRTLKHEKLRNEVSWGMCAGAERLHFHTTGVSGSSPLTTLDLFFSFFPRPLDTSSVPLLYTLSRRAESHGLAFMCMWHYQNAHMTVHQLWLLTKWHRKTFCTSSWSDMTFFQDFTSLENMPDTPALSPLSLFFFFPFRLLHL